MIDTAKAVGGLIGVLNDPNCSDDIRQNVTKSLSYMHQPLAIETLINAYENKLVPLSKTNNGKLEFAGQKFDSIEDVKSWYELAKVRYKKGDNRWWEKAPTNKEAAQYAEMTQAIENGWMKLGMNYNQITAKWGKPTIFMNEGHGKSFAVYPYNVGSVRSLIFNFENEKLVDLKDNTGRKISIEDKTVLEERTLSDILTTPQQTAKPTTDSNSKITRDSTSDKSLPNNNGGKGTQITKTEKKTEEFISSPNIDSTIYKAAVQNDIALIKSLIDKGANVNAADQLGWTGLHFAANQGYRQAAELLLNNGAVADAKANNDARPLHLAAEQGRTAVAELLLSRERRSERTAGSRLDRTGTGSQKMRFRNS